MINTTISSFFGKKREIKSQVKEATADQSEDENVKIVETKRPNKRVKKEVKVEYPNLGVGPATKNVQPCGRFGAKGTKMNRVKTEADYNKIDTED